LSGIANLGIHVSDKRTERRIGASAAGLFWRFCYAPRSENRERQRGIVALADNADDENGPLHERRFNLSRDD